jgi:hypothetical protein
MEAHGPGVAGACDKVKTALMLETDRAYVLRLAILACRSGGTVSVAGVYGGFIDEVPLGAVVNRSRQPPRRPQPRLLARCATRPPRPRADRPTAALSSHDRRSGSVGHCIDTDTISRPSSRATPPMIVRDEDAGRWGPSHRISPSSRGVVAWLSGDNHWPGIEADRRRRRHRRRSPSRHAPWCCPEPRIRSARHGMAAA